MFSELSKELVWWMKVWQILLASHYWYKKIKFLMNKVWYISINLPNSPNFCHLFMVITILYNVF